MCYEESIHVDRTIKITQTEMKLVLNWLLWLMVRF